MAEYQLTALSGVVQRGSDGAFIPPDENNADYREYQAWIEQGNVPDPYVPPAQTRPAPE